MLVELLLGKEPNELLNSSVWAVNSSYYIDGKRVSIGSEVFRQANTDELAEQLEKYKSINSYSFFDNMIRKFVEANISRLNYLKDEASRFINGVASRFEPEQMIISFSGGKDSTATADTESLTGLHP